LPKTFQKFQTFGKFPDEIYGKFKNRFLYNKLTIMETNKILQSDYLDLIFDNRNKSYGGYELRKHYNRRALKALGITFSVILFGIGTPFIISQLNAKASVVMANSIPDVTKLTEVFLQPPPEPPHAPKPPERVNAGTPPVAKTIIFTEPKIVNADIKPDIKPPDMKELETSVVGAVNNSGEGGTTAATTDKLNTGRYGDGSPTKNGEGSGNIANDKPRTFAEVMPEFPGGMAALLAFIQKNLHYPAIAREEGIEGKVVISFIVNAVGEIEGAKVVRNIGSGCDKEALRVVNAMPKWKPGRQNGHNVKVYYTLPITFKLQ
jgi:protein TonB